MQFQDEVEELASAAGGAASQVVATNRFRHLPAAGLLPLAGSGRRGFDLIRFFTGLTTRPATFGDDPVYAEGATIERLLR